jgi:hypothetical protein
MVCSPSFGPTDMRHMLQVLARPLLRSGSRACRMMAGTTTRERLAIIPYALRNLSGSVGPIGRAALLSSGSRFSTVHQRRWEHLRRFLPSRVGVSNRRIPRPVPTANTRLNILASGFALRRTVEKMTEDVTSERPITIAILRSTSSKVSSTEWRRTPLAQGHRLDCGRDSVVGQYVAY